HGADVYDSPAPLTSHVGYDGARHPHDAEEVRVEDRASLFDRAFLRSRGAGTEARVVHEEVDAAFGADHLRDGGFDRRIAGDVERQRLVWTGARLRSASAGAVNFVAGLREPRRRGFADA